MEVCRACQKPITEDQDYLYGRTGWRASWSDSKYHVECFNKEKKKAVKWYIFAILIVFIIVGVALGIISIFL